MRSIGIRGLLVLGAAVLLAGCSADGEGERIRAYDVVVDAAADGSLWVEETIQYDFADEERHGIERSIPDRAPFEQTRDRVYPIDEISVRSPSGAPTTVEVTDEGGHMLIRVGDEDGTITGRHTYVLSYRVAGVVDTRQDEDVLAWDAVGTGWEVPIDEVLVRFAGPSGVVPGRVDCAVGVEGETTDCPRRIDGGEALATAQDVAAGEGVTVRVGFPAGSFPAARSIYRETFSPAQAFRATPATVGVAVAALLLPLVPMVVRARRRRDRSGPAAPRGSVTPQLTPPQDARPGQLGTLLDGHAQRREFTATLLDLAMRGYLRIEEVVGPEDERDADDPPTDWLLVRLTPPASGLRPYERGLLDAVFDDGERVVLSDMQEGFTGIQATVTGQMYDDVVALGWFEVDPSAVRRRWYMIGAAVLVGGATLTAVLALLTTWALPGVGVVLAGVVLVLLAARMPRRTVDGDRVREQTAAFREQLASADPSWLTESVRVPDLADAARADVAIRYLPYAVALGVADQWASSVHRSGVPEELSWYQPAGPGFGAWSALFLFSSSDNPALSPSASSGGGAGSFGVGSGAGGGGGGSW